MYNRQRGKRPRVGGMPEISLTPLIDTALVLLVIFMVATPMLNNAIKVDLPKGHVKEATGKQPEEITVYIDSQDKVYLNGHKVKKAELVSALEKQMAAKGSQQERVFVHADRSISYGSLIEVVDSIKGVPGVAHVVLATQKA